MVRRSLLQGLALMPWLWAPGSLPAQPQAHGIELAHLELQRSETELTLDFDVRVALPRGVEDAMQRGVPVYFVADATLYRSRWYWRDERVARVQRSWRVAYQPLTSIWRVGFGGFNQNFQTLGEALTAASRSSRWKVADSALLDPDSRYYLDFSYRLDTSQLPSPMQIGLGGQAEWVLGVERQLRLE